MDRYDFDRIIDRRGTNALKYDSLVKAHKDYYGKLTDLEDLMMRALFRRIEGLHITSDQDYDEQHPAGSLLNDLFDIEYRSFAKYVESGYDDSLFTNNNDDDQAAATRKRMTHLALDNFFKMTTTRKPLNKLMDNDLRLIVASYYTPSHEYPLLITECLPVIDMQQTLTIKLYLDDGTTRTGYVETVFE